MSNPTLSEDGKSLITPTSVTECVASLERKKVYIAAVIERLTAEIARSNAELTAINDKIAAAVALGYVAE